MPEMNKKGEIWKGIPEYEGYYQVSSLGRVRSLDRTVTTKHGVERFYKGRIIEGNVDNNGYRMTTVSVNGEVRKFRFSQLVAMSFLGHEPNGHSLVIDHINGDRSDDRLGNLQIVTHRANLSTCFRYDKDSFSSEYVGVDWHKKASKWRAKIRYNKVRIHLGYYDTELEASKYYQSALSKIKDGSFNVDDYKPDFSSSYKGVHFKKRANKWVAKITINGKQKHIGYFKTELEAYQARLKAEQEINDGIFLPRKED